MASLVDFVRLQKFGQRCPTRVHVLHAFGTRDHNLARVEDEQHNRHIGRSVDEAGEHVWLIRAEYVKITVKLLQVQLLVGLEPNLRVADDILNFDRLQHEDYAGKPLLHLLEDRAASQNAVQHRLAPGQHHLARGEKKHSADWLSEADGNGRKLLSFEPGVWQQVADCPQVELRLRAYNTARADKVVDLCHVLEVHAHAPDVL